MNQIVNYYKWLLHDALDTATPLAESEHRFEILLCPRSTGVQTKFLKTRTVEISSDLIQSLNEYRISERRLKLK